MTNSKDNSENVKMKFPGQLVDFAPVLANANPDTCRVLEGSLTGGLKIDVRTIDLAVSTVFVTPLVIGQWRGTWMLAEYYSVPWWACFLTGSTLHFMFALLKDILQNYFSKRNQHCLTFSPLFMFLVSRAYTWVFGVACISHWRGAWAMVDHYAGRQIGPVIGVTLVSLGMLSATKTLRNINTSPFSIIVDGLEPGFTFPTMFRTSGSKETSLYVLDCLFSVIIVGTLVVFVWRGAWTILDLSLYPSHLDWSAWTSMALGYAIVVLTFSLQTPLKGLCGRLEGFRRVCVVDVYLFFSFCGTINVWRGVWMLLNIYFLPDNPEASYWVTHAGCLLILMLIKCSNSILVRGVYIDAEEEGGKCVVFPCYYLRLFIQKRRREKLLQLQIQQQLQQNATHVATTRKGTKDVDSKTAAGFITVDTQQPNCTANHHAQFPLETLEDVP
ncbi:uncharacterized protein LOC110834360 isoform X1 [Zootermopsis nevadensis]|uniref:uncharacterized protein LOC110834360 isoform X1 n=1 Tax=Zootermopsis nevadensis TaxID=136037 RepID=UPI000B8EC66F|nr:uncharacterized protein LOC110834360 isoform X1 [Zootermopsis nevadensis]XP_021929142.1 uncharacterized protein LOC110834360 isoform X1 [Zootermopsis nevadensis]XP_021929143.1 uncharacterized protein LOC110834360 isoform X1 [Zootermopsis nevadensis]